VEIKMDFKGLKKGLKALVVRLPFMLAIASFITRNSPRIFMYHRFCDAIDHDLNKIDKKTFEWQLRSLSKKWKVLTLQEYIRVRKKGDTLPPYLVILTMDDGYRDFYEIAYPSLIKHELSGTFFPTVAFVEGEWLWFDRLKYLLQKANKDTLLFNYSGREFKLDMTTSIARDKSWQSLCDFCLHMDEKIKWDLISQLEKNLNINVPVLPTEEFGAVTWNQLREMSRRGIEIGSHSMKHPVLSQLSSARLAEELTDSKKIIEDKVGFPVSSFCYPNGTPNDINERVFNVIQQAGYEGATVSYNDPCQPFDSFRIPRMGVSRDRVDWLWKLSGLEFLIQRVKNYLKRYI
jgi:peptidoglycan/xylan/chitin deacetylase (PgdA/CDA1 family)